MKLTHLLSTPGLHRFLFPGPVGDIEVELEVPEGVNTHYVAIIGHPHPLHGGTMHNKVVTTAARVFKELRVATIRFNFRGVGRSAGVFDEGIGESDDMLFIARQWKEEMPSAEWILVGFSFGSYVAYRTAAMMKTKALILIAPPVHHFNYTEFSIETSSWIVVQGELDDVAPTSLVLEFVQKHPTINYMEFEGTGHFFHGNLVALKERLIEVIQVSMD